MYRANWFSWVLTGLALAVMSFVAPPAKDAQKGGGSISNEWRLAEPVRYENLSVFPVVSSRSADTPDFATLDEGLSAGQVVITEGGTEMIRRSRDGHPLEIPQQRGASVNQLVLINRGSKPLLLLAGELVSGGKQDRIISKDRFAAAGGAPLPLDVFCVEAGRWTGAAQFSAAKLMVHPSVREQAAIVKEQAKVWDAVRSGTTAPAPPPPPGHTAGGAPNSGQTAVISPPALGRVMATEAPTQSYEKMYKSSTVGVPVDTFAEEVQRRFDRAIGKLKGESVVGVVVAYGGEVAWRDIFASPSLFEGYWRSTACERSPRENTSRWNWRRFVPWTSRCTC